MARARANVRDNVYRVISQLQHVEEVRAAPPQDKKLAAQLGERLGNAHLTPAQGASAEVVAAVLIGTAGFTGLPVSTTHIVTSGIGGTMVSSGAGLRYSMLSRILTAWLLTLPVTIVVAAALYYILASPAFR